MSYYFELMLTTCDRVQTSLRWTISVLGENFEDCIKPWITFVGFYTRPTARITMSYPCSVKKPHIDNVPEIIKIGNMDTVSGCRLPVCYMCDKELN